jgi:hypothetical protein
VRLEERVEVATLRVPRCAFARASSNSRCPAVSRRSLPTWSVASSTRVFFSVFTDVFMFLVAAFMLFSALLDGGDQAAHSLAAGDSTPAPPPARGTHTDAETCALLHWRGDDETIAKKKLCEDAANAPYACQRSTRSHAVSNSATALPLRESRDPYLG